MLKLLFTSYALLGAAQAPSPSMPAGPLLAAADSVAQAAPAAAPAAPGDADLKLIGSAMRAAPPKVAEGATIVAVEPGGRMRTLREGRNGFTCMPDNPATPGPDPMCMDKAAMEWVNAWMARKPPVAGRIGFMYMLEGGTDASNTDPFAQRPIATNHWLNTGPNVMVVGADAAFYDQYPRSANPDTAQPYIMWPGTPWQHLMIPVR